LVFNPNTAALTSTDLVPGTAGLAPVVGVGGVSLIDPFQATQVNLPAFQGVANTSTGLASDNVVTQGSNGSLDVIGFSGGLTDHSLTMFATDLLSGTVGLPPIGAMTELATIIPATVGSPPVLVDAASQFIAQTASGQLDALYLDSGYNEPLGHVGAFYGSNLYGPSFSGSSIVNAGAVAAQVFT
jgi:hypothetical protein